MIDAVFQLNAIFSQALERQERYITAGAGDRQREAAPTDHCTRCGAEQYGGDTLYRLGGRFLCGECVEEQINALTTQGKAYLLGMEPVRVGEP